MNTKKRWIITIIVALALAAVVVIGVILNHSADRVLKATEGTEEAAGESEEEPAEEEELPSEETVELELPVPDEETAAESVPEEGGQEEISEMPEENETPDEELSAEPEEEIPDEEGSAEPDEETSAEASAGPEEENPGEDAAAESEEEMPDEEEQEEEAGETELRATAADGTQVIVQKLEGSFPAGAYVEVLLVSDESAQSAVEKALDGNTEVVDLIAYDITIYDKDGNEIVPDNDVQLTIIGASLEEGEGASVYHIEENGQAEKITDVQDSAEISFGALPD